MSIKDLGLDPQALLDIEEQERKLRSIQPAQEYADLQKLMEPDISDEELVGAFEPQEEMSLERPSEGRSPAGFESKSEQDEDEEGDKTSEDLYSPEAFRKMEMERLMKILEDRKSERESIKEQRKVDRNSEFLANTLGNLGKFFAAKSAGKAGVMPTKLDIPQFKFDRASQMEADRKSAQKELLDQYKLLRSARLDSGPKPTVGQQTVDKEFGKELNAWNAGGKADYEENSKIFREAIKSLKSGKVDTGTLSGMGSDFPGVRTKTRELETRVRKAINGMLRATLGAQFTEKEGERIFQQTFDPYASPEENIKNMETELAKLEKRKDSIQERTKYFNKNKTLAGYEPSASKPSEVRRKTKDGKIAIFDANTKKFLRYED